MATSNPEQYFIPPTVNVPNSPLPALIYRNVLPAPPDRETAKVLCEANNWEKRGEWGEIMTAHFHPNTHECYAVVRGESRLVLGRQKPAGQEETNDGVEIDVRPGDVIVVPAGVSHRSLSSKDDYFYIGVYPKSAPRWRNNYCNGEEGIDELKNEIRSVDIPDEDPVYGVNGPLPRLWRAALEAADDSTKARL